MFIISPWIGLGSRAIHRQAGQQVPHNSFNPRPSDRNRQKVSAGVRLAKGIGVAVLDRCFYASAGNDDNATNQAPHDAEESEPLKRLQSLTDGRSREACHCLDEVDSWLTGARGVVCEREKHVPIDEELRIAQRTTLAASLLRASGQLFGSPKQAHADFE